METFLQTLIILLGGLGVAIPLFGTFVVLLVKETLRQQTVRRLRAASDAALASAGWPGPPYLRTIAGHTVRIKVAPTGIWTVACSFPGGEMDLDGLAIVGRDLEVAYPSGDDAFDQAEPSLFLKGPTSTVLHRAFRAAWPRLSAHGKARLNPSGIRIEGSDAPWTVAQLQDLEEGLAAVLEALTTRPGLEAMARTDPLPAVRARALDRLTDEGQASAALLEACAADDDPAVRLRAKAASGRLDGWVDDAMAVPPYDLDLVLRHAFPTREQAEALIPALLSHPTDTAVAIGVGLVASHDAAEVAGRWCATVGAHGLSQEQLIRVLTVVARRPPPEALPRFVPYLTRLPSIAADVVLQHIAAHGDISMVPELREVQARAQLLDDVTATRIDRAITRLQADARGGVGDLSIAAAPGGEVSLVEPEPPPRRPRRQTE